MPAPTDSPVSNWRRGSAYPIVYMFSVTLLATGMLVGIQGGTAARVEANRRVLLERAVLMALGLAVDARTPPSEVHGTYLARMSPPTPATAGAYRLMAQGRVEAYALPFEGRGFWNVVKGVVGIRADGRTLTGLAFYEQSETPGLGAEIVKPRFTAQFRELALPGVDPALRFRPPESGLGPGEVHAITGATQTCTRLEAFLSEAIGAWRRQMGLETAARADREETP